MDNVTQARRSFIMSQVKSKNSKIEIEIRKGLFSKGLRFRIHKDSIPGKPDIYIGNHNIVVFVNGCFWHLHGCLSNSIPDNNRELWLKKLMRNKSRDIDNWVRLTALKYRIVIIWSCSLTGRTRDRMDMVITAVMDFLTSSEPFMNIDRNGVSYPEHISGVYYE